jgi:hypothetical protein
VAPITQSLGADMSSKRVVRGRYPRISRAPAQFSERRRMARVQSRNAGALVDEVGRALGMQDRALPWPVVDLGGRCV